MSDRQIPAPPATRVPTVWGDDCRYCTRYRRPCGRHEDLTIYPAGCACVGRRNASDPHSVHCASYTAPAPLVAVWTPQDYADTVAAARAHRANPSNVVAL